MQFDGAKVIVTGGGRGIGLEIARALSERGAIPILVGRNTVALRDLAEELGGNALIHATDLSQRDEVDALIDWSREEHSDLTGLINNAAVQNEFDLLNEAGSQHISLAREEIALNLDAAVSLAVGLLPALVRQRQAFITNVTTGLVFGPKETSPIYCASKAGLHVFTRALRYQCQRNATQVQVSEVILPMVDTDMTAGRGRGKISPKAAAQAIVDGIASERQQIWVGKTRFIPAFNRFAPNLLRRMLRGDGDFS